MAAFLFQIELPDLTEDIIKVIPTHRNYINKLLTEGKILSYSVSQSRNMIWCVVSAKEEGEAMQMVLEFPLYKHFTETICYPLLFYNSLPALMPGISLN